MENLTIVGLWGGWYTAWIYWGRYGLSPLLIWENDGGLITENPNVENFPWYSESVSGRAIMQKMKKQAENFWARSLMDIVKTVSPIDKNNFKKWYNIDLQLSWSIETRSIILALGTEKVKLWIPWEKELFWKWVSYCATCDGLFFRGKKVAVVGWGDTALIEAFYLSEIVEELYLIHRRTNFRWEQIRLDRLNKKKNVQIITPWVVEEIQWESKVESIKVSLSKDSDEHKKWTSFDFKEIDIDGIFIAVWTIPKNIKGLDDYLKTDQKWYLEVSNHQETNLPWVFAAWDFTTWSGGFRQLVTACGEWAVAAESAFKYISKLE